MGDGWKIWKYLKLDLEIRHVSLYSISQRGLTDVYQEKNSRLLPRGRDLAKGRVRQGREHSGRSRRTVGNPENKTTALVTVPSFRRRPGPLVPVCTLKQYVRPHKQDNCRTERPI